MQPRMLIVAGPPGSGKSTAFPVYTFGLDSFNADDQAAALNGGSYQGISQEIRSRVGKQFEKFVTEHIEARKSFAIETTLRTDVTFRQAELAKKAGFRIEMLYVSGGDFDNCLKRVIVRGFAGGHSAPAALLKAIYTASLQNLPRAIREMDELWVYDNSRAGTIPKLTLEATGGKIGFMEEPVPVWLAAIIKEH